MSKILKIGILIVFALGFLFLGGTEINAATRDITSIDGLESLFDPSKISVTGNTITLNENVSLGNHTLNFKSGDYIVDLNEHILTFSGSIAVGGGSITFNGDLGRISVGEDETLDISGGIFNCLIASSGNLNISGGEFIRIENIGDLTITGGTFNALYTSYMGTNVITGGTFLLSEGSGDPGAIIIDVEGYASEDNIIGIIGVGYEANYLDYSNNNAGIPYGENSTSFYNNVEIVEVTENYSDIFKKITQTDTWTVNAFRPASPENSEFLLSSVASDLVNDNDYQVFATSPDTLDVAYVSIYNTKTESTEAHIIKVAFNQPGATMTTKVNSVLNKMKRFDTLSHMTEETAYLLDDLYLVNYLNANSKGFDNANGGAMALNFAKDLINATNGSNISFRFDARAGSGNGPNLYSFAMGQAIVYHNGVPYTSTNAAITASNVLYIPKETENTPDAYMAAALKRIKDYLGTTDGITIALGGTLESLNHYDPYINDGAGGIVTYNEKGFIDDTTAGGNYYNITFNGQIYKFAICKKDASKLETPKYVASDLVNNILIASDATTIPLDTALSVRRLTDSKIEKALGTNIYAAYDISLYSKAKNVNVTRLDNGKFIVSIPVPTELQGKEIIVYYITSTGEKETHKATVKDGIASFETDHFSTYVLAENKEEKDITPKTGVVGHIGIASVIGIVSLLGTVTLKKNNE